MWLLKCASGDIQWVWINVCLQRGPVQRLMLLIKGMYMNVHTKCIFKLSGYLKRNLLLIQVTHNNSFVHVQESFVNREKNSLFGHKKQTRFFFDFIIYHKVNFQCLVGSIRYYCFEFTIFRFNLFSD